MNDLSLMPNGRVLLRYSNRKMKLRIVTPVKLKICDECGEKIDGKAAKWEKSANVTLSVLCLACAVKEVSQELKNE